MFQLIASSLLTLAASGEFPVQDFCTKAYPKITSYRHMLTPDTPENLGFEYDDVNQWLALTFKDHKFKPYLQLRALYRNAKISPRLKISNADLIGGIIGANRAVIATTNVDDLKLLPMSQSNRDVLLLTDSIGPLTGKRAHAVVRAATAKNIRIFTVWLGKQNMSEENHKEVFRLLSAATGGVLLDLSGQSDTCKIHS